MFWLCNASIDLYNVSTLCDRYSEGGGQGEEVVERRSQERRQGRVCRAGEGTRPVYEGH